MSQISMLLILLCLHHTVSAGRINSKYLRFPRPRSEDPPLRKLKIYNSEDPLLRNLKIYNDEDIIKIGTVNPADTTESEGVGSNSKTGNVHIRKLEHGHIRSDPSSLTTGWYTCSFIIADDIEPTDYLCYKGVLNEIHYLMEYKPTEIDIRGDLVVGYSQLKGATELDEKVQQARIGIDPPSLTNGWYKCSFIGEDETEPTNYLCYKGVLNGIHYSVEYNKKPYSGLGQLDFQIKKLS